MKVSMLFDIMRWEERAILKSLQDRNVEVQLLNVKDMNLNLEKSNYDFGDISLQRSTEIIKRCNIHEYCKVETHSAHRISIHIRVHHKEEPQSLAVFYQLYLLYVNIHLLFTIHYYYIISITMNPNNAVSALPEFHYITGL